MKGSRCLTGKSKGEEKYKVRGEEREIRGRAEHLVLIKVHDVKIVMNETTGNEGLDIKGKIHKKRKLGHLMAMGGRKRQGEKHGS